MTDHDRRNVAPEVAEPEPDAPRWLWDDQPPTPFALGLLLTALLFTGSGILVLGFALVAALSR